MQLHGIRYIAVSECPLYSSQLHDTAHTLKPEQRTHALDGCLLSSVVLDGSAISMCVYVVQGLLAFVRVRVVRGLLAFVCVCVLFKAVTTGKKSKQPSNTHT